MPVLSLACHLPHNTPHIPSRYNNEQTTKQTKAINNSYIYINISCKCDTNRAGHFTLDAYASRPVACHDIGPNSFARSIKVIDFRILLMIPHISQHGDVMIWILLQTFDVSFITFAWTSCINKNEWLADDLRRNDSHPVSLKPKLKL